MIYSFLYVIAFSIALILIQKLDVTIPPLFSLLITASIASIFFNLINIKQIKKIYTLTFENIKQWFIVMIIVLIMWTTTMIGPGKIGASLFNFIYFAWLGAIGFFVLSFQNWNEHKTKFYYAITLSILILANIYFELENTLSFDSIYGIMLALVGGASSYIYFKQSQSLAKKASLSATQVLAVRFYFAIMVLILILPKEHFQSYLSLNNLFWLSTLAFLSLIIPLYFSQKALEKITSEQHAIINSLCPITTGIIQTFMFHDLRIEQIIVYILYSLVIGSFYILPLRKVKTI